MYRQSDYSVDTVEEGFPMGQSSVTSAEEDLASQSRHAEMLSTSTLKGKRERRKKRKTAFYQAVMALYGMLTVVVPVMKRHLVSSVPSMLSSIVLMLVHAP